MSRERRNRRVSGGLWVLQTHSESRMAKAESEEIYDI
nr:MAG TPA: hypothetical protein [Caudoviricetes sp.]